MNRSSVKICCTGPSDEAVDSSETPGNYRLSRDRDAWLTALVAFAAFLRRLSDDLKFNDEFLPSHVRSFAF